jgi:hypothetical protein
MKQMKSGFVSLLPGGKLKPPDWSSPEGSEASRLLERELTSRFIGGTFDSATPIAEVRRAHLSVLGHWTFAQLGARAASSDFEKRYPGMVAWFCSGRTPEGIERRAMQRSESRSVDLPAKMLDRALISTAEGLQHAGDLGAPAHYALVLATLGPLRRESDVGELDGEKYRLSGALQIAKRVLGRLLGVSELLRTTFSRFAIDTHSWHRSDTVLAVCQWRGCGAMAPFGGGPDPPPFPPFSLCMFAFQNWGI